MKQEVKDKWTQALRSRQYIQGKHALRKRSLIDDLEQHCCLGVLCDLAVAEGVLPAPVLKQEGPDAGNYEYRNRGVDGTDLWPEAGVLPGEVIRWAELGNSNPEVPVTNYRPGRTIADLAELNDHGYDFNQIAELIEENL